MSKYADAIRLVRNSVGAFRDPVERRRRRISFDLARKLDFTVQVGPLKGFRVAQNPSWGRGDLAGMLLGLYEAPVLSKLVELSEKFCAFIDIGAADGYYGVGLVKSDIYQTSYCFEMSSRSQRSLAALAAEVGVVDRVKIAGRADSGLVVYALNALGDGGGAAIGGPQGQDIRRQETQDIHGTPHDVADDKAIIVSRFTKRNRLWPLR